MPYCPECHSEYAAGNDTCIDCNAKLIADLPEDTSSDDMINVYVCYDGQQAERAMQVLRTDNLSPFLRDRSSMSFPTSVGTTAQRLIAVPFKDAQNARELINSAVEDEVIGPDGKVLGMD